MCALIVYHRISRVSAPIWTSRLKRVLQPVAILLFCLFLQFDFCILLFTSRLSFAAPLAL